MELVLPKNYVEIEEEEMMYLDGGDAKNFANNLYGLLKNSTVRKALGVPSWKTIASMSYWTAMAIFPGSIGKMAAVTGNPVVVGIATLGGIAAFAYLWKVRVFY